jgi:hypothetical protein
MFSTKKVDGGLRFEAPVSFVDVKAPMGPDARVLKEALAARVPDEEVPSPTYDFIARCEGLIVEG